MTVKLLVWTDNYAAKIVKPTGIEIIIDSLRDRLMQSTSVLFSVNRINFIITFCIIIVMPERSDTIKEAIIESVDIHYGHSDEDDLVGLGSQSHFLD